MVFDEKFQWRCSGFLREILTALPSTCTLRSLWICLPFFPFSLHLLFSTKTLHNYFLSRHDKGDLWLLLFGACSVVISTFPRPLGAIDLVFSFLFFFFLFFIFFLFFFHDIGDYSFIISYSFPFPWHMHGSIDSPFQALRRIPYNSSFYIGFEMFGVYFLQIWSRLCDLYILMQRFHFLFVCYVLREQNKKDEYWGKKV